MYGREELYAIDGAVCTHGTAYVNKAKADAVMNAMEAYIKELEAEYEKMEADWQKAYADECITRHKNHSLEDRIAELEATISNESKWIPVYYDLPEYGKTVRVRTINSSREVKEGTATYHDGGDWGKDYWTKHGDTVGRITHWMPLPSTDGLK